MGRLLLQFVGEFGYMITYVFPFHTTSNHQNASFYYMLHPEDPEPSHTLIYHLREKNWRLSGERNKSEVIRTSPSQWAVVFDDTGTPQYSSVV